MNRKYILAIILFGTFLSGKTFGSEESSNDLDELKSMINKCVTKIESIENDLNSIQEDLNTIKQKNILSLSARLEKLEEKIEDVLNEYDNFTGIAEKKKSGSAKEILSSIEISEEDISNLPSRLDAIEQKQTESFETIDVLKKAIAELRKSMERQEVATGLLEKDIKKTPKLEKSQEKSLEAQLSVISEIVVKHDKQLAKKEGDKALNIYDVQGYQDLGGGFFVKDLKFKSFGSSAEVSGTILNASGRDYNVADFKVFLYDKTNTILWEQEISIMGISNGESESFDEILTGGNVENITKYAFVFGKDTKPSTLVTIDFDGKSEEEKIGGIENASETKAHPGITDDFKEIGGNFLVKDVTITKTDILCNISGVLKNISPEHYGMASFIIKLFDKKKRLLEEKEFSVNFVPDKVEDFSVDILEVNVDEIDSYKISFKKE